MVYSESLTLHTLLPCVGGRQELSNAVLTLIDEKGLGEERGGHL